jgi:hypothetical protein
MVCQLIVDFIVFNYHEKSHLESRIKKSHNEKLKKTLNWYKLKYWARYFPKTYKHELNDISHRLVNTYILLLHNILNLSKISGSKTVLYFIKIFKYNINSRYSSYSFDIMII